MSTHGIGIPDNPLSPHRLDRWDDYARIVARTLEEGLDDRVAWSRILGPTGELAAYKTVYGNRKTRRPRNRQAGHLGSPDRWLWVVFLVVAVVLMLKALGVQIS